MKKGMRIESNDNVGVVLENAVKGDKIQCGDVLVIAQEEITTPHKISLSDISKGSSIIKFGAIVGYATKDIPKGSHVHVHNMDSEQMMK